MANLPLIPIDHKGFTRAQAADLLRGMAELVELYPTEGVVVTLDVAIAATGSTTKPSSRKKKQI